MSWQRARTDEKKSERKVAICDAAVTLFKKSGYDNVSFNGIASEAGFTKSNMYRYFSSKEEIFLNIFSDLFGNWVDECVKLLDLSHAATSSFGAQAAQNDVLKKIYKEDEFKELKPNFEKDLTSAIEIFILGIKAKLNQ